jgi:cystathionine beta-lyase/cystathionine gamma-synthase
MTHASLTPEAREELGITDTLVRFSVGIEDVDDLKADIAQAMKHSLNK